MARYILFEGTLRLIVFVAFFDAFEVYVNHPGIALLARATVVTLLGGLIFNLVAWHWKNRRYLPLQDKQS
jgi:uncharacterized YccA/Bax inhibitor family protein